MHDDCLAQRKSFLAREDVQIRMLMFRSNAYMWYPYFTFHCHDQNFSSSPNHQRGQTLFHGGTVSNHCLLLEQFLITVVRSYIAVTMKCGMRVRLEQNARMVFQSVLIANCHQSRGFRDKPKIERKPLPPPCPYSEQGPKSLQSWTSCEYYKVDEWNRHNQTQFFRLLTNLITKLCQTLAL